MRSVVVEDRGQKRLVVAAALPMHRPGFETAEAAVVFAGRARALLFCRRSLGSLLAVVSVVAEVEVIALAQGHERQQEWAAMVDL